jgi:hypothetical protein
MDGIGITAPSVDATKHGGKRYHQYSAPGLAPIFELLNYARKHLKFNRCDNLCMMKICTAQTLQD